MPRREAHAVVGIIAGTASYFAVKNYLKEQPSLLEALGAGVLGGCVGVLPDVLEPATTPNHRAFLHSWALLTAGVECTAAIMQSQDVPSWKKVWATVASAAYASHLILDGCTPKSLPLVGLSAALLEISQHDR